MAISSVGASSVKKEDFDCVIRKIICENKDGESVLMYERNDSEGQCLITPVKDQGNADSNALNGYVSNLGGTNEFYIVTDHNGTLLHLKCEREENGCIEENHRTYVLDYIDITTRQNQLLTNGIDQQEIKLSYYNLFLRAGQYSKEFSKSTYNSVKDGSDFMLHEKLAATAVAYGAGGTIGDMVDTVASLRFILLPEIDIKDYDYECHAVVSYRECPHIPTVPEFLIHIYPAIEYNLEIGFFGFSRSLNASLKNRDKINSTCFKFEFNVKYASHSSKIEFGKESQRLLTKEEQKGADFYRAINGFGSFLRATAAFTDKLVELLDPIGDEHTLEIKNDLTSVMRSAGGVGNKLAKPDWIYGQIDIQPSVSAIWRYEVSSDMRELQRYLEILLGVSASGSLTVDLVKLSLYGARKAKKISTIAAATATVASGGLAGIPAILIKFLIDAVLSWLMKKFEESVKLQVVLSCNINSKPLSYNSMRENNLERFGRGTDIQIQLQILASLSIATSVTLLMAVKAEGNAEAYANTSASVKWEYEVNVREGIPGIDQELKIDPLKIKIGYQVAGGYEIWIYSSKNTFKEKTKEWKFGGTSCKPERLNFFKVKKGDTANRNKSPEFARKQ